MRLVLGDRPRRSLAVLVPSRRVFAFAFAFASIAGFGRPGSTSLDPRGRHAPSTRPRSAPGLSPSRKMMPPRPSVASSTLQRAPRDDVGADADARTHARTHSSAQTHRHGARDPGNSNNNKTKRIGANDRLDWEEGDTRRTYDTTHTHSTQTTCLLPFCLPAMMR